MSTIKDKSNEILIEKQTNLLPENIKEGITIFDVMGTYSGNTSSNGNYEVNHAPVSFGGTNARIDVYSMDRITIRGDILGGLVSNKYDGITLVGSTEMKNNYLEVSGDLSQITEQIYLTPDMIIGDEQILNVRGKQNSRIYDFNEIEETPQVGDKFIKYQHHFTPITRELATKKLPKVLRFRKYIPYNEVMEYAGCNIIFFDNYTYDTGIYEDADTYRKCIIFNGDSTTYTFKFYPDGKANMEYILTYMLNEETNNFEIADMNLDNFLIIDDSDDYIVVDIGFNVNFHQDISEFCDEPYSWYDNISCFLEVDVPQPVGVYEYNEDGSYNISTYIDLSPAIKYYNKLPAERTGTMSDVIGIITDYDLKQQTEQDLRDNGFLMVSLPGNITFVSPFNIDDYDETKTYENIYSPYGGIGEPEQYGPSLKIYISFYGAGNIPSEVTNNPDSFSAEDIELINNYYNEKRIELNIRFEDDMHSMTSNTTYLSKDGITFNRYETKHIYRIDGTDPYIEIPAYDVSDERILLINTSKLNMQNVVDGTSSDNYKNEAYQSLKSDYPDLYNAIFGYSVEPTRCEFYKAKMQDGNSSVFESWVRV